jgi:hypothetical protein
MIRHCEHIKANGHFCGSPAMRGRSYCFYHATHIGRQLRLQRYASLGLQAPPIELPLLEDAASIQLALMQVTEALLQGTLDRKTAGLVLYSLQTASINVRNMQKEAEADAHRSAAICDRYDSLEQDYELDAETAASLRVEEPAEEVEESAEEEDSGDVVSSEEQPGEADAAPEDGSSTPQTTCARERPLRIHDDDFQMPIKLSEEQYLHAQVAIFQYRLDHNIDANDRAAKVIPQRPAISQKISLRARKPVASVTVEEESQRIAASN